MEIYSEIQVFTNGQLKMMEVTLSFRMLGRALGFSIRQLDRTKIDIPGTC